MRIVRMSKKGLCALVLALCVWSIRPACAQTYATLGNVDGVVGDGTGAITLRGWACWQGYVLHRYSPQLKLYVGGEAGQGGTELGIYQVDQPSEQAVEDTCRNQNPNNRFVIGLSIAVRQQYGGQRLYVYAQTLAVPEGGYVLLQGSGQYTVPAAPAVSDSVYYIHTDRLGSNVIMTDANANVVAKTDYKAYGAAADNGNKAEAPGFIGQYEDPLTGLTYMQARYYDADLGRFISVDPIAARTGDMFNFNRYAYAANNPMNLTDPTGLDYCQGFVNGVAAGIGYCGDNPGSIGSGGPRDSNRGGAIGGPGEGGGGSIPTEDPVNVTANRPPDIERQEFFGFSLNPQYVTAYRMPNQISCGTVLPDGSTVGDRVTALSHTINDAAQITSTPYGPSMSQTRGYSPLSVPSIVYSQTNFKIMFRGQGNAAFLGDAGNFAYAAVAANIGVPLFVTEMVAGGYALWAGHRDTGGPFWMDASATRQVPAGYSAACNVY
ncbi:RHS repeat-associated core domain-containing protein [Dyella monticola]|uniref:RHS repeat-associated core domain-containing protein n=1 Tax=Dyella monticola TaxID=1927958 RepID=UPI00131450CE|nr:RHS repeat-associated core domain-containing protein [Dyella monticola]